MGYWEIKRYREVGKFWEKLHDLKEEERTAYEAADALLQPYPGNHPAGLVTHLKGGLNCNHEYRRLPNAQRLIYKVQSKSDLEKKAKVKGEVFSWDDADKIGEVHVYYVGPHLAGKGYIDLGKRMQKPLQDG